jgi:hypothetical protein
VELTIPFFIKHHQNSGAELLHHRVSEQSISGIDSSHVKDTLNSRLDQWWYGPKHVVTIFECSLGPLYSETARVAFLIIEKTLRFSLQRSYSPIIIIRCKRAMSELLHGFVNVEEDRGT